MALTSLAVRVGNERIATLLLNELARREIQDLYAYLRDPLGLAISKERSSWSIYCWTTALTRIV